MTPPPASRSTPTEPPGSGSVPSRGAAALARAVATICALAIVVTASLPMSATVPAAAQEITTSTTTLDPTSETAPILELTPDDGSRSTDGDTADASTDGGKVALFIAAIVLPLAGIAFLLWYARRAAAVARHRAAGPDKTPHDEPHDTTQGDSGPENH